MAAPPSSSDDEWTVVGDVGDNATLKLRAATLDVLHGADSVAAAREAAAAAECETHMVALARGRLIADMCRGQASDAAVEEARAPGGHAAALQLLHDDATWEKVERQFARDAPRQDLLVCGVPCATGDDYKAAVRRALDVAAGVATAGSGVIATAPPPSAPAAGPGYVASAGWFAVRLLTLGWLGAATTTTGAPQPPAKQMTESEREGAYRLAVALAQQQSLVPLYEGVRTQFDASAGGALLVAEVSPLDALPDGASRRAVIHVRETAAGSGRFVVEVHKWLRVLRPNSATARNGHTLLLVRAVLTCPLDQADPAGAAKAQYDADAFLEWRLEVPLSDGSVDGTLAAAAASAAPSVDPAPLATSVPKSAAVNSVASGVAASAAAPATSSALQPAASTASSISLSRAPAAPRLPFFGGRITFPGTPTQEQLEAQKLIENALRRAREVADADAAHARRLSAAASAAAASAAAPLSAASSSRPADSQPPRSQQQPQAAASEAGLGFGAPAASINVFAPTEEQIAAQREIEASLARANAAVNADAALARALAAAPSVAHASSPAAPSALAAAAAAIAPEREAISAASALPLAAGPVSASFFPAFGAEATPSQLRLQAEIEEEIRRSIEQDKADREAARRLFEQLNGAPPSGAASSSGASSSAAPRPTAAAAAAATAGNNDGRFGPSLLLEALQRTASGARAALDAAAASTSTSSAGAARSGAEPSASSGAPPPPRPAAMGGATRAAGAPALQSEAAPRCSCLGASAGHHRPTCPLRR